MCIQIVPERSEIMLIQTVTSTHRRLSGSKYIFFYKCTFTFTNVHLFSINIHLFSWTLLFSSPEPMVQVNYCHHLAYVVCRPSSVNFSHFKLLLRNHWANWNQTLQKCPLDGPLQSLCFSFQLDSQHGCRGQ